MKNKLASLCCAAVILLCASLARAEPLPLPDHVVVVIQENKSYDDIMSMVNRNSYIHELAQRGMLFTRSYGITHPSQPNYLALFSGSTQGVTVNSCPHQFNSDNLATALLDAGLTFASYSESLPMTGDLSCMSGAYQRKHNPVANWQGTRLPPAINQRFADFPKNFSDLPTVSFVIPDQNNDMHDGSFEQADAWLRTHLDPYVEWAMDNNSLLILTWDEDDYRGDNHIVTLMVGPMVQQGESVQQINHYNLLRTLLDFYDLPALGESTTAEPITGIWQEGLALNLAD
ncbi:MAG: alkaline phosphatase family protein [Pseudomonadota bacterium]